MRVRYVGDSVSLVLIGYLADTIDIQTSFGFLAMSTVLGLVCISLLYSSRIYLSPIPIHL